MTTSTNSQAISTSGALLTTEVDRLRVELSRAQSDNAALRAALARTECERDRYLKAIYDLKRDSLREEIAAEFGDDLDPESLARVSAGPAQFLGTNE